MEICKSTVEELFEELFTEAKDALKKYIQINTVNPPGNVDEAVAFLESILQKENIEYKIYSCSSGKKAIAGFIRGEKKDSLLLLNHMDVVPADQDKWEFDAFSGEERNGCIEGRGALDMKGLGVAQLMAMIFYKRQSVVPKKTVVFLAVPDEEIGGKEGAKYIVDNYWEDLNPVGVLDEGGFGTRDINEKFPVFFVACGQKKGIWLQIKAHGKAGHASQPSLDNPNDILIKALHKIITHPECPAGDKILWDTIIKVSKLRGGAYYLIAKLYKIKFIRSCIGKYLHKIKFFNAIIRNTETISVINSGIKVNVIPEEAEALIDCRILPKTDYHEVIRRLEKLADDERIEFNVIKEMEQSDISDSQSALFKAVQKSICSYYKNAKVLPYITPVGTDAKYFREKKVDSYGIYPIVISQAELESFHGNNEKVPVREYKKCCEILIDIIDKYCCREGEN